MSTKQSNELISAEAELDANQVKAECGYWRKVVKTSEKRVAKLDRIKKAVYMTTLL